jgi:putative addiction module component (TIGR02574 family)
MVWPDRLRRNLAMASNVEIENLTADERLALLGEIWDSLSPEDVPITDAQRVELDRRLDDLEGDSNLGIPWDEVLRRIRNRPR